MFDLGLPELIVMLVIILIVFGMGRLPEMAGSLGKNIRGLRSASDTDEVESDASQETTQDETDVEPPT